MPSPTWLTPPATWMPIARHNAGLDPGYAMIPGMARRLLDAGRPADAYAVLQDAQPNLAKNATELADLRIAALFALGCHNDAQAARWQEFARILRERPLRDFSSSCLILRMSKRRRRR